MAEEDRVQEPNADIGDEGSGEEEQPNRVFPCWCCDRVFDRGNSRQAHYQAEHAVCNPHLVTTQVFSCERCQKHFPTQDQRSRHECPVLNPLQRLRLVDRAGQVPVQAPGAMVTPGVRHLYTDGSGGPDNRAGWAVVVFDAPPNRPAEADYTLFGPVVLDEWDPVFLGAEVGTNNTGELTAIGEACVWLWENREERTQDGQVVPAVIHYDSEYARDLAVRAAAPRSNQRLAESVASWVEKVRSVRPLEFRHVKGHSGDVGNDAADKFANRGREGHASPQWGRWADVPGPWVNVQNRDPDVVEVCRHCGRRFDTLRSRAAHEGRCGEQGVALPAGMGRCRKCGQQMRQRTVRSHEEKCRGLREANLICALCGEEFPDFRLLRVHEFDCARLAERRAAKASAPPPPPPVPAMREEEAAEGQCHQCGQQCGRNLSRHLRRCRGSELANRTCRRCGREYASWDSLRSHEARCRV